jgi:hypothetical protein
MAKLLLRCALIVGFLIQSSVTHGYPIFFRCDQDQQMSEFMSGKEVLDGVKSLLQKLNGDKKKLFDTLCEGKTECEKNLDQVLKITKITAEASQKRQDEILNTLTHEMDGSPIQKTSEESFQLEKNIRSMAAQLNSCRQTEISLEPDAWTVKSCILFYYPFKNEYSYASGFKVNDATDATGKVDPNGKKEVRQQRCIHQEDLTAQVRKALIMGVDPMVFLSLGLMEEGYGGAEKLYLDPIGVMKAMGCPETKSDVTHSGAGKLESYGNFHQISPKLIEDKTFNENSKRYVEEIGGNPPAAGISFFCTSTTAVAPEIKSHSDPSQCCMKLNYQANDPSVIQKALTLHYVHKMKDLHPYGQKDPAFQMQSFNGFSRLMGGGEGVSTFRAGVDFTKTPSYGYQSMDYILNNLAANPVLLKTIDNEKKKLNLKHLPASILCQDPTSKGPNVIDSHKYFDLHRNSGRLASIKDKPYASLSSRERKVLDQEMSDAQKKKLLPDIINGKKVPRIHNARDEVEMISVLGAKSSSGVSLKINSDDPDYLKKMDALIDKNKLQKGFHLTAGKVDYQFIPSPGSSFKFNSQDEYFVSILESPFSLTGQMKPPFEVEYPGKGTQKYLANFSHICLDSSGKEMDCSALYELLGSKANDFTVKTDAGPQFSIKVAPGSSPYSGGQGSKEKIIFSEDQAWVELDQKVISKVEAEALEAGAKRENQASMEEVREYYFKNVYLQRNTIEKASSYGPWKLVGDDDIQAVADHIAKVKQSKNNRAPAAAPPGVPATMFNLKVMPGFGNGGGSP